ncbi:MAG TPA: hypothetical protein VKF61_04790 [Candidatus Polarisedimenticolia bacterium]|nr:hypothetical protein [Candidatus Polarisedimenticolia bacterium]
MTISEPTTFFTDMFLAGASLSFGLGLTRAALRERQRSIALWAAALLAGGAAALLGGIYHGLGPALGAPVTTVLWKGTVWLAGVSALTSVLGSLTAVLAGQLRGPLNAVAWAKFAAYAVWMSGHDEFRFVVYDQMLGMAAILLLHGYDIAARNDRASRFIALGVFVSVVAAAVQRFGFDLHPDFNHNDLFHAVQIGANYLFYRGALLLRDRDGEAAGARGEAGAAGTTGARGEDGGPGKSV